LKQNYPRIEYIVLDDGSTDNTTEVLEKYTGRLIWESHPNMGETRTVNKGWSMAQGEIVAVVNSDDPLLPGAVSQAVAFMQAHPDILVAYPDWDMIGPNSEFREHFQVPDYDYLYMLGHHHCILGPGAFIRRKAFELTGMRDPEFRYVADFEYWLRLGLYGKFARIPKTLATWRVHPDTATLSHKGTAMADEHIRLMQKFYSRPDLPLDVRKIRAEAYSWAYYIAAISVGSSRRVAFKYYLKSVGYHPRSYLNSVNSLTRLGTVIVTILPRPLYKVLLGVWHRVNLQPIARYRRIRGK
jgi:glycosyltransferase involved in cell wall biosynthesis